jgi:outer membrane protein assembly factor BamB
MRLIMRRLLITLLPLALAGCGSMNPMNWWSDDSNEIPVAELVDIQERVRLQKVWSASTDGGMDDDRVKLVPFVYEGNVFVAEREGKVKALNAGSGRTIWSADTELNISGGPGAGEGLVLVGTSDGEVVALDEVDGEERWRARVSSEVLSVPKASQGVVVVHTIDGKLFALNAQNGKQLWFYDRSIPVLTLHGSSSPVISGPAVFCGFSNGRMVAFELESGRLLWEATVSVPRGRSELERMVDIDGDPLVLGGLVFVATFQGDLAAIVERSGEVVWRRKLSSHAGLGGDFQQLYVTDEEDHVWAIDPRNGAALWKQEKMFGRRLTAPIPMGNYVLVGDHEGYVHVLSPEDGDLIGRIRVGSDPISTPPRVVGDVAYILGDGGDLAAITVSTSAR